MKKITLAFAAFLLLLPMVSVAQIVSSSTERDTLAIPFSVLDSTGNKVSLSATDDSVYLVVWSPGGSVVHSAAMLPSDPRIVGFTHTGSGRAPSYVYVDQVFDLVGGSLSYGTFSYEIMAFDSSLELNTITRGHFQRIGNNSPYYTRLDSIGVGLLRLGGDAANFYDNVWLNATRTLTGNVTLADGHLTAAKFGSGFLTATGIAAGALNGKGDWRLSSNYPTNFASLAVTAGGATTVGTNNDKTGYTVSGGSIASVSGSVGTVTGNVGGNVTGSVGSVTSPVTVGTNQDKTGYSMAGTIASLDALDASFRAKVDTLSLWLGLHPSSLSITHYQTDHDTVFVYSGSDLLGRLVYYHVGGTPGAAPDSVRTEKDQ